jgi:hypothetical protein
MLRLSMARATVVEEQPVRELAFKMESKVVSCVPVLGQAFPPSDKLSALAGKGSSRSPLALPVLLLVRYSGGRYRLTTSKFLNNVTDSPDDPD